jgi:hypothetical protein
MPEVQCSRCLTVSSPSDLGASDWDCPCGSSYSIRRCAACGGVSQVSTLLRRNEAWNCTWCKAPNTGYTRRNDPAAATLVDLAEDMTRHGFSFATRTPQTRQAAMRFDCNEIGDIMSEVAAYGTAVTVQRLTPADSGFSPTAAPIAHSGPTGSYRDL